MSALSIEGTPVHDALSLALAIAQRPAGTTLFLHSEQADVATKTTLFLINECASGQYHATSRRFDWEIHTRAALHMPANQLRCWRCNKLEGEHP